MYCHLCRIDTGNVCHQCGLTLSAPKPITESANAEGAIFLWNPDIAAFLSWALFGISFGAAVHAANWKRLGHQRRMWESIAWATLPLGSAAVLALLCHLYEVRLPAKLYLLSILGMNGVAVICWYFTVGREQSKYVLSHHKGVYARESWFGPIAIAVTPFIVVGAIFA